MVVLSRQERANRCHRCQLFAPRTPVHRPARQSLRSGPGTGLARRQPIITSDRNERPGRPNAAPATCANGTNGHADHRTDAYSSSSASSQITALPGASRNDALTRAFGAARPIDRVHYTVCFHRCIPFRQCSCLCASLTFFGPRVFPRKRSPRRQRAHSWCIGTAFSSNVPAERPASNSAIHVLLVRSTSQIPSIAPANPLRRTGMQIRSPRLHAGSAASRPPAPRASHSNNTPWLSRGGQGTRPRASCRLIARHCTAAGECVYILFTKRSCFSPNPRSGSPTHERESVSSRRSTEERTSWCSGHSASGLCRGRQSS